MAPEDTSLPMAMVSLILYFSWNWIGLAISDNDQGTQFLSYLRTEMEKNILCFAFVNMIPLNLHLYMSRAEVYYNQILLSSSNVVIIYGDPDSTLGVSFRTWTSRGIQRIWVTTSQFDVTTSKSDFLSELFLGTLTFAHHHAEISGFKNFIQTVNPLKYSDEYLARLEWMNFNCEISDSMCKTLRNGSSNSSLEWVIAQTFDMAFSDDSYDIYNAVYTMAHAFHRTLLQPVGNEEVPHTDCLKVIFLFVDIRCHVYQPLIESQMPHFSRLGYISPNTKISEHFSLEEENLVVCKSLKCKDCGVGDTIYQSKSVILLQSTEYHDPCSNTGNIGVFLINPLYHKIELLFLN